MCAKSDTQPKSPTFEPDLLKQLLAERKTAGEIEDLLKDLRKAFIEHALQGELTHLLGYEKHLRQVQTITLPNVEGALIIWPLTCKRSGFFWRRSATTRLR